MGKRKAVEWVVATVMCCWTTVALGQATPETATRAQKKEAFAAYAEGKKRYEAGDYAAAVTEFERSQAAVQSASTRLMLARSLSQLGRKAEAYDAYGEVAGLKGGDETTYKGAVEAAELERVPLRSQVAQLTVDVQGDASSLRVGGRAIEPERWGQALTVDPGVVEVVSAGPSGEQRQSVGIGPGEGRRVSIGGAPPAQALAAVDSADVAPAEDTPAVEPEDDDNALESRANIGLVLGAKVGGGLGKPFSDFGATPVFELELGYMLPLGAPVGHGLEVFLTGQYAQPGLDGTAAEADPRLPGSAPPSYEVTQQALSLALGGLYRLDVGTDLLMPYGGLGARMYLLDTKVKGSVAGQSFGDNEETQTAFGLVLLGGIDVFVGPGALLAELSFGWAKLDGFVMRDTNMGALSLAVGYRVML